MRLRGLVISPVLPEKSGQGNRARVYDMISKLQEHSDIDLVYYMYESKATPAESARALSENVAGVHAFYPVLPAKKHIQAAPQNGHKHTVDEWWDPALEHTLNYLAKREAYDYVLVNYVWLSKAFDCFPGHVAKILETHDVFTDRDRIFTDIGLKPEFFYCEAAEEQKGLSRADLLIALQDKDRDALHAIAKVPTVVIPHLGEGEAVARRQEERPSHEIVLGLLGVANTVNVTAFTKFCNVLLASPIAHDFKILVAGSVGKHLPDGLNIKRLGFVPDLADFFADIDLFVNPVERSTGQKIKLADAIACEVPFISTENGSEGLGATCPSHIFPDIEALIGDMAYLPSNRESLVALRVQTQLLKKALIDKRADGFRALFRQVLLKRRVIVVAVGPNVPGAFYSEEMNFTRAAAFAKEIKFAGHVSLVSDLQVDTSNEQANEMAPAKLGDYLTHLPSDCIDVLIRFGGPLDALERKARKILVDGLSNVGVHGTLERSPEVDYMLDPLFRQSWANRPVIADAGITHQRQLNHLGRRVYILASSYDDLVPKAFKKIISSHHHCEIILPHQIKHYSDFGDYSNLIANAVCLISMDSSDLRYALLKVTAMRYGVQVVNFDRLLAQSPCGVSITTLYKMVVGIGRIASRLATPHWRDGDRSIWTTSQGIWNYLRS